MSAVTNWFADRSLGVKILTAVGLMAAVCALVETVSLSKMSTMNHSTREIYYNNLIPIGYIDQVAVDMQSTRITVLKHGLATTAAEKAKYRAALADNDAETAKDIASYTPLTANPTKLAQLKAVWDKYRTARDTQVLPVSDRNDIAGFDKIQAATTSPLGTQAQTLAASLGDDEAAQARIRMRTAASDYSTARTLTLALFVLGLALAIGLAALIIRSIVHAVQRVGHVADGLAEGDLTRSAQVTARDEVGRMSASLDTAVARMREALRTVGTSSDTLAGAAEELTASSAQMANSAQQTGSQADTVSSTSAEISHNVQSVAAGTEEMGAAIREIAASAAEAAGVTQRAVGLAQTANDTITRLGESSVEIGTVVKLITSIAEQTNLLALNATIEAARAGELGKGFAVVAGEVKDLAQATSKATEDIAQRIEAIQAESSAAVSAITEVSEVISQVDGYSATIASAVEEQSATTSEMARNVTEVANGSDSIAGTINGVASAAQATTQGAEESRRAAADLARMSSELQQLVGQFRV